MDGTPTVSETERYERRKSELIEEIEFLEKDLELLKAERKNTAKHIELGKLPGEETKRINPIIDIMIFRMISQPTIERLAMKFFLRYL